MVSKELGRENVGRTITVSAKESMSGVKYVQISQQDRKTMKWSNVVLFKSDLAPFMRTMDEMVKKC